MNNTIVSRKELAQLRDWYSRPQRKPLVLRGARQVGKSTLVRELARSAEVELYEINLERHLELDRAFSTFDIKKILLELEGVLEKKINATGSLLFLDEIQATPHGLAALRYFYEETKLAVVAAGSLLEFALGSKGISMPVGRVEYFYLGPLSFEDFLVSLGETYLLDLIRTVSSPGDLSETAHNKLSELYKEYLIVGGLPEAVVTYAKDRDFAATRRVHASISETYQDDFIKYGSNERLPLMQRLFRQIPRDVGNKVKYSKLAPEYPAAATRQALELLIKAGVFVTCYHSDCGGVPIGTQIDTRVYKLLALDVGLMNHICGLEWHDVSAMSAIQLVNSGGLAEQFIGQHLLYDGPSDTRPELCYWLREGRKGNAEVDYVVQFGSQILPVEVKAGKSGSLKSLFQFVSQRNSERALRFDLNPPSRQTVEHADYSKSSSQITFELISLPLYMVDQLKRWITEAKPAQ